jgi:hypothetical protein
LAPAALLLAVAACSAAPAPSPPVQIEVKVPPPVASVEPAPAATAHPVEDAAAAKEGARKVHEMLQRVSTLRGLPIQHEVPSRVLDRAAILAKIRAHVEKEIPRDAVEHEGELLAALELVPSDYDFVAGTFKLIEGRIAGFYEPADQTMYMVDDLGDEEATETLAHELDHALQDQAFSIGKMIEYAPGQGDRISAAHAVIEGDAMSAMFDVVTGSAFDVSDTMLRTMLAASNALSDVSATTPHVLQSSLTAPYGDGFAFVQRRRTEGGWPAVDAAMRDPPRTTEQLLHPEKYASREPAIDVPALPVGALGPGFRAVLADVVGEQGLLLMLEEWTGHATAAKAAAGWGGDRYVIARRDDAPDRHAIAVGWRIVMDTERDAGELATVLKDRLGTKCRERAAVGPLAWKKSGREVVIAAGPYERRGTAAKSVGSCATAGKWLGEIATAKR